MDEHELWRLEAHAAYGASIEITACAQGLPDGSLLRHAMLGHAHDWQMFAEARGVTSAPVLTG